MKALKYIFSAILLIAAIWSCTKDEFGNIDFVSTAGAPTNVSALFKVTQDNTGLVSIAPTAEGAVYFEVYAPSNFNLIIGETTTSIGGTSVNNNDFDIVKE